MKTHFLFHVPFEEAGAIGPWAQSRGPVSATRLWNRELPPAASEFDFLIVMGGPMNIYEDSLYPWLAAEKKTIAQAIQSGKKVLGVCLGAQLIADVLGGKVTKNKEKEIGWFSVEWTPDGQKIFGLPAQETVFHWHGDTFALPPGAKHIARSKACENQAFLYDGRVLGLQFHLESTPESVRLLAENCREELVPGKFVQTEEEILSQKAYYDGIHSTLDSLLSMLVKNRERQRA